MLRQLCDDASYPFLIEDNGVTSERGLGTITAEKVLVVANPARGLGQRHRLRGGLETTKTDLQVDGYFSNTPFCMLPSNKFNPAH